MKVGIFRIIKEHIGTLKDDGRVKFSREDILIFYLIPLFVSFIVYYCKINVDPSTYDASISVFAIFCALLLNVQIALFGIHQRNWAEEDDNVLRKVSNDKLRQRTELLREVNTNISYLTIISAFAVTIFLILKMAGIRTGFTLSLSIFIYIHFFLTMIMVIKRAHALFSREYT